MVAQAREAIVPVRQENGDGGEVSLSVRVPAGMAAGDTMEVTAGTGTTYQFVVPVGLAPNAELTVELHTDGAAPCRAHFVFLASRKEKSPCF